MNSPVYIFRHTVLLTLFVVVVGVSLFWQVSPKVESAETSDLTGEFANYDIRTDKNDTARKSIEQFVADDNKTVAMIALERKRAEHATETLRAKTPNLKIEYNEDLRIPEVITPDVSKNAFLTSASNEKRADILRDFLRQNPRLFGLNETQIDQLETTADYTNLDGNLSFVHFEQKINDIPVFRGEVKAGFTRSNEIVRMINNLAPNLDYEILENDFGRAEQAVKNAAKHINLRGNNENPKRIETESNDLKITFERGQFDDKTTAEKLYFPIDYGVARAAWRVLLWTNTGAFYEIVDAETAEEYESAFARLSAQDVGGVVLLPDAALVRHRVRIAELALKARLPTANRSRSPVASCS